MKKDKQKKYIHKIMNLKYESIIVTVSMVFIFLAFLFTGSYQISQDLQRTIVYGRHNGAVINVDKEDYQNIKNHIKVEETGLVGNAGEIEIIDGENITVLGNLGIADQSFFDLERFEWIDGRIPENNTEAVVETTFLDNMHLSYSIDQKIQFTVVENGIQKEKEYTIVGIIRSISANWLNVDMPGVLTIGSEEEIMQYQRNCYFYSSHDSEEEMSELKDLLHYKNEELIYNSSSYPEKKINTETIYEYGIVSYVFVLLFIFGYMLVLWKDQGRIRQRVKVLKNYGCENRTILLIVIQRIFNNWIKGTMTASLITAVLYVAGIIATKDEQAYTVHADPMILALISIVILLLMVIMNSMILIPSMHVKNTEENGQIIKKHKTDNKPFTYKKLCKIESLQQRKHVIATCILSVVGICVITMCIYEGNVQYGKYESNQNYESYRWDSVKDGLTDAQIKTIEDTYGVDQVLAYSRRYTYYSEDYADLNATVNLIDRSGENDEYIHVVNGNDQIDSLPVTLVTFSKDSPFYDAYIKDDYKEAFDNGELVVLGMPDTTKTSKYGALMNMTEENEIENSEIISFKNDDGHAITLQYNDSEFNFTNMKILTKFTESDRTDDLLFITMIVSPELYAEITGEDANIRNTVLVYGNKDTNESTSIKLSKITENVTTISFSDQSEYYISEKNRVYTILVTIIAIFIFAFVLTAVLIFQNQKSYFEMSKNQISLFTDMGTDRRIIKQIFNKPNMIVLLEVLTIIHFLELFMIGIIINLDGGIWLSSFYLEIITILRGYILYYPWQIDILCLVAYCLVLCVIKISRN